MTILLILFLNAIVYVLIFILYIICIKILKIGESILKNLSKIKEYIFVPLSIWKKEKMKVFLWGIFTVGVSMSGIIFDNFFKFRNGTSTNWISKGDFYIISLSLLACSLNTILIEEVEWARDGSLEIKHKNIKIVVQVILMLLILMNIIFYSTTKVDDYSQIIIFVIVLLVCFYVFCVDLIKKHDEYNDLGEYLKKEEENMKKLQEKVKDLSSSDEGVKY